MQDNKETEKITAHALMHFTGSEHFYKHVLMPKVVYTEGCAFLSLNGAGWLIDAIASYQPMMSRRKDADFQEWVLTVETETEKGILACHIEDPITGNVTTPIVQRFDYTDFPLPEIKFFVCRNELGGFTIMLTSEY